MTYNTLLDETEATIYKRFAEKNINILSINQSTHTNIVVEYAYNRPSDKKLIWPKLALRGDNLLDTLRQAEGVVDEIRGE